MTSDQDRERRGHSNLERYQPIHPKGKNPTSNKVRLRSFAETGNIKMMTINMEENIDLQCAAPAKATVCKSDDHVQRYTSLHWGEDRGILFS